MQQRLKVSPYMQRPFHWTQRGFESFMGFSRSRNFGVGRIDFHGRGINTGPGRRSEITTCERFFSRLAPWKKEDAVYAALGADRRHLRSLATPLPFRGMIMLAIKAARKVWKVASNEARCVFDVTAAVFTVPCLSCFTAARIAAVKCTHKSGTFNRVIWQTGARRLPEKSFRVFIRARGRCLEKGCYERRKPQLEEERGIPRSSRNSFLKNRLVSVFLLIRKGEII